MARKMQGGGGGGDPFNSGGPFGGPFGGSGGSFGGDSGGPFGGYDGPNGPPKLVSNIFGGRDPFNDPFFTQPFGGGLMSQQSLLGPSMMSQQSLLGPSMMSQQSLLGPSMMPQQSLLGPSTMPQQSLLGSSMMSPQSLLGPSTMPQQSLLGPSVMSQQSLLGPSVMSQQSLLGPSMDPFAGMRPPSGFIENHQPPPPPQQPRISRGPIIEEIDTDDEKEGGERVKKGSLGKHGRSSSEAEAEAARAEEMRNREMRNMYANVMANNGQMNVNAMTSNGPMNVNSMANNGLMNVNAMANNGQMNVHAVANNGPMNVNAMANNGQMDVTAMVNSGEWQPQTSSYSFQSSEVTYGGHDGHYYASLKTRRVGSDGLTYEERKEANTATREAAERVSRGLHNKGHTVARKLNSDGRVDTTQTLHNLNEGGLVNRDQPMLLPSTDPSPSRARAGSSKRSKTARGNGRN
ncbi:unnamed protein product [Thlaspi arvense]|uniref:Uncharacterized protein n=1 Tax=Thlaspi arvense TaxID=13288 RepID=A0AAU9T1Z5_THLAR|nr:unnamed protein product [Thlaspi arvense]